MTSEIDNGGPAFPVAEDHRTADAIPWTSGLSIRDYFAAHALRARWGNGSAMTTEDAARVAYQLADAMIEERKRHDP